jgi:hypothetical protein
LFDGGHIALDLFTHEGAHEVEHDIPFDTRVSVIMRDHGAALIKRDHPVIPKVMAGNVGAVRLGDLTTERDFRKTELCAVAYRPVDIRFQLLAPFRSLVGYGVLTINRDQRDFSEREVALVSRYARTLARAVATERMLARVGSDLRDSEEALYERLARRKVTRRESSVLFWLSQGKRTAEIALILGIAFRTVEAAPNGARAAERAARVDALRITLPIRQEGMVEGATRARGISAISAVRRGVTAPPFLFRRGHGSGGVASESDRAHRCRASAIAVPDGRAANPWE